MTTIAANLEMMAADSQVTYGHAGMGYKTQKIYAINGVIYGLAGDPGSDMFLEWAATGFKPKLKPNFSHMWSDIDFDVLELSSDGLAMWDKHLVRMRLKDSVYAVGSGAPIALLLMRKYGMTPDQAVVEACEHDTYTEGPVDVLYLKDVIKQPNKKEKSDGNP